MQDIEWLTDVINSFAILASVQLLWNVMAIYIISTEADIQSIPQNFYCSYPKNSLLWNSVYPYSRMVSYDLLLFVLKIQTSTGGTNSMPFPIFRRDHLWSTSGIICGSGSFAVQFGDHFWSGDHLRSGSFAALYRSKKSSTAPRFSLRIINQPTSSTSLVFFSFLGEFHRDRGIEWTGILYPAYPVLLQSPTTHIPCILQWFWHTIACSYIFFSETQHCYSRNDVRSQLNPFSAIPRSWTWKCAKL